MSMQKNLVLLRHSNAEFSYETTDYARKLTPSGEEKCFLVGEWFTSHSLEPQKILCSPAQRTKATLQGFLQYFPNTKVVEYEKSLYEANPNDLLQTIQKTSTQIETLLIVCHEPAVSYVANWLANPKINADKVEKLSLIYPPLSLSYFTFRQDWKDLSAKCAVLQDFTTFSL